MKLKDLTNAAIGVIDKKLERFDPKWQAERRTCRGKSPSSGIPKSP